MSSRRGTPPPAPAPPPVVPGSTSQQFPYGGRAGQYARVKADGSGLELRAPTLVVEHHTAADTLLQSESGSLHTNLGASGTVPLSLPPGPNSSEVIPKGICFEFITMTTAEILRIDPGPAGAIYINGAKQTDDKYIQAIGFNDSVKLVSDGNGDWLALFTQGSWSVEA